jgi:hypothetical protein
VAYIVLLGTVARLAGPHHLFCSATRQKHRYVKCADTARICAISYSHWQLVKLHTELIIVLSDSAFLMAEPYSGGRQGGYWDGHQNQGGQVRGGGYGRYQGGTGGRGHDGGRGGRGRGGGGRSDPWQNRTSLEQEGLMVKTNCFEIHPIDRSSYGRTIIQYVVQILPLRRVKNTATGEYEGWEVHPTQKALFAISDNAGGSTSAAESGQDNQGDLASQVNRSSTLSRRILNACQKTIGQTFVS